MPRNLLTLAQTCREWYVPRTDPLVVLLPHRVRHARSHRFIPVVVLLVLPVVVPLVLLLRNAGCWLSPLPVLPRLLAGARLVSSKSLVLQHLQCHNIDLDKIGTQKLRLRQNWHAKRFLYFVVTMLSGSRRRTSSCGRLLLVTETRVESCVSGSRARARCRFVNYFVNLSFRLCMMMVLCVCT